MGRRWWLVVLAVLFALVSGCSSNGDGGDGVASMSSAPAPSSSAPGGGGSGNDGPDMDQMRAYAKCMREHGVDMEDPQDGGISIAVDSEAEQKKVDKANEACKHLMPNGGEDEKPTAEDLDNAREMAKCLREHGIDVKEPTMDSPGISVDAGSGGNDPEKVNKAMEECAPEGAKGGTRGRGSK